MKTDNIYFPCKILLLLRPIETLTIFVCKFMLLGQKYSLMILSKMASSSLDNILPEPDSQDLYWTNGKTHRDWYKYSAGRNQSAFTSVPTYTSEPPPPPPHHCSYEPCTSIIVCCWFELYIIGKSQQKVIEQLVGTAGPLTNIDMCILGKCLHLVIIHYKKLMS